MNDCLHDGRPDIQALVDRYYSDNPPLRGLLMAHSCAVARKAMECASRHPELQIDLDFAYDSAMLHDIGIVRTWAPGIYCRGELPYICHGIAGREMLEHEGWPRHALVCERHTGSGLSSGDIERQGLPLPVRDMLPLSLEEKLVCYADKFFSKTPGRETEEKPIERVRRSMGVHGEEALARFEALHCMFG